MAVHVPVDWFDSTVKLCYLQTNAVKQLRATVHDRNLVLHAFKLGLDSGGQNLFSNAVLKAIIGHMCQI